MRKIPCLFKRIFHNDHTATLTNEVVEGCEWVLNNEGQASVKTDGTACMIKDNKLYARLDCKPSKTARKKHKADTVWNISDFKTPPSNSIPCQEPDIITGHWPHWVLVENQPEYKYHREGLENTLLHSDILKNGTYELIGPKIGNNPEKSNQHLLVKHGSEIVFVTRTFDTIHRWLQFNDIEGLVFAHPDGRMCKIRRRDYGLQWPIKQ